MTKVKEPLNIRINEHIPWRDLSRENVPYSLPFSNGYLFEWIWYSFEWLGLSVQKKIVIHTSSLDYLLEKIVIGLNGLG